MTMIRRPAVAGTFYPGSRESLSRQISGFEVKGEARLRCIGAVAPHAGYVYSGAVAGELYSKIEIPPVVIILAPNHRGPFVRFALSPAEKWQTPLGDAEIDADLASAIARTFPPLELEAAPHYYEHSAEVQVPFLQYFRPDVKIVPIVIAEHECEPLIDLGKALAQCIRNQDVLIVASSDMTHFEDAASARHRDMMAIEKVLAIDPEGLHEVVHTNDISMCGVSPAIAMLAAARELGAKTAELVRYANSGDVSGDHSSVVGYASVRVF